MYGTLITIGHLILFFWTKKKINRRKRELEVENAQLRVKCEKLAGENKTIRQLLENG